MRDPCQASVTPACAASLLEDLAVQQGNMASNGAQRLTPGASGAGQGMWSPGEVRSAGSKSPRSTVASRNSLSSIATASAAGTGIDGSHMLEMTAAVKKNVLTWSESDTSGVGDATMADDDSAGQLGRSSTGRKVGTYGLQPSLSSLTAGSTGSADVGGRGSDVASPLLSRKGDGGGGGYEVRGVQDGNISHAVVGHDGSAGVKGHGTAPSSGAALSDGRTPSSISSTVSGGSEPHEPYALRSGDACFGGMSPELARAHVILEIDPRVRFDNRHLKLFARHLAESSLEPWVFDEERRVFCNSITGEVSATHHVVSTFRQGVDERREKRRRRRDRSTNSSVSLAESTAGLGVSESDLPSSMGTSVSGLSGLLAESNSTDVSVTEGSVFEGTSLGVSGFDDTTVAPDAVITISGAGASGAGSRVAKATSPSSSISSSSSSSSGASGPLPPHPVRGTLAGRSAASSSTSFSSLSASSSSGPAGVRMRSTGSIINKRRPGQSGGGLSSSSSSSSSSVSSSLASSALSKGVNEDEKGKKPDVKDGGLLRQSHLASSSSDVSLAQIQIQIDRGIRAHKQAWEEQDAKYKRQIASLEDELAAAQSRNVILVNESSSLRTGLESVREKAAEERKQWAEDQKRSLGDRVEGMVNEHERKLRKVRQTHSDECDALRDDLATVRRTLARVEQEAAAQLANLRTTHARDVDELRSAQAGSLEAARRNGREEASSELYALQTRTSSMERAHAAQIDELKLQHRDELRRVRDELVASQAIASSVDVLKERIANLRDSEAKVELERSAHVAERERRVTEREEAVERDLRAVKLREREVEIAESERVKHVERNSERQQFVAESYEKEREALAQLRAQMDHDRRTQLDEHKRALNELQQQREALREDERALMDAQNVRLEEEQDVMRTMNASEERLKCLQQNISEREAALLEREREFEARRRQQLEEYDQFCQQRSAFHQEAIKLTDVAVRVQRQAEETTRERKRADQERAEYDRDQMMRDAKVVDATLKLEHVEQEISVRERELKTMEATTRLSERLAQNSPSHGRRSTGGHHRGAQGTRSLGSASRRSNKGRDGAFDSPMRARHVLDGLTDENEDVVVNRAREILGVALRSGKGSRSADARHVRHGRSGGDRHAPLTKVDLYRALHEPFLGISVERPVSAGGSGGRTAVQATKHMTDDARLQHARELVHASAGRSQRRYNMRSSGMNGANASSVSPRAKESGSREAAESSRYDARGASDSPSMRLNAGASSRADGNEASHVEHQHSMAMSGLSSLSRSSESRVTNAAQRPTDIEEDDALGYLLDDPLVMESTTATDTLVSMDPTLRSL